MAIWTFQSFPWINFGFAVQWTYWLSCVLMCLFVVFCDTIVKLCLITNETMLRRLAMYSWCHTDTNVSGLVWESGICDVWTKQCCACDELQHRDNQTLTDDRSWPYKFIGDSFAMWWCYARSTSVYQQLCACTSVLQHQYELTFYGRWFNRYGKCCSAEAGSGQQRVSEWESERQINDD